MSRSVFCALVALLLLGNARAAEVNVSTSDELQGALDNSLPGDHILLGPYNFSGEFRAARSGTAESPIIVAPLGELGIIMGHGTGVGLVVTGDHWKFLYFGIQHFDVGLVLNGSDCLVDAVAISNVNKGVMLHGQRNTLANLAIKVKQVGVDLEAGHNVLSANAIKSVDMAVFANNSGMKDLQLYNNVFGGKMEVDGELRAGYRESGNVYLKAPELSAPVESTTVSGPVTSTLAKVGHAKSDGGSSSPELATGSQSSSTQVATQSDSVSQNPEVSTSTDESVLMIRK